MKCVLIFCVVLGFFAGQASAAMWEVNRASALGFTTYSNVGGAGDSIGLLHVYDGPGNEVYDGGGVTGYDVMSGMVGFTTTTFGDGGDGGMTVTAKISYGGSPGLPSSTYDGIECYFENDDDDIWSVQLFYIDPCDGGEHASSWVELGSEAHTYLMVTASSHNALDLSHITDIGFRVQGNMIGPGAYPTNPDAFHISLVPEPSTFLLLGLGAFALRRRKK